MSKYDNTRTPVVNIGVQHVSAPTRYSIVAYPHATQPFGEVTLTAEAAALGEWVRYHEHGDALALATQRADDATLELALANEQRAVLAKENVALFDAVTALTQRAEAVEAHLRDVVWYAANVYDDKPHQFWNRVRLGAELLGDTDSASVVDAYYANGCPYRRERDAEVAVLTALREPTDAVFEAMLAVAGAEDGVNVEQILNAALNAAASVHEEAQ